MTTEEWGGRGAITEGTSGGGGGATTGAGGNGAVGVDWSVAAVGNSLAAVDLRDRVERVLAEVCAGLALAPP